MNGQRNSQNIENGNTEDAFLNQCQSCCYEFQQSPTYPCMYNDIIHEYKLRLKKAHDELMKKELMISVMRDQHAKMENYCRCNLEDTRNIKAKYKQLVMDMENMKKNYMIRMSEPGNENTESLKMYLRCEVDTWKRENREIFDKIEMIDGDVQKLLQLVSDSSKSSAEKVIEERIERLERVIEKQSEILDLLHSKVEDNSKATKVLDQKTQDNMEGNNMLSKVPSIDEELIEVKTMQKLEAKPTPLVLNPDDDVRISIQIQRASKIESQQAEQKTSSYDRNKVQKLLEIPEMACTNTQNISCDQNIDPNTSATNTELFADFLEIVENEKQFFKENDFSTSEVHSPTSTLSEKTPSEQEKGSRELPEKDVKQKENWNNFNSFDEIEHFESAFLYDQGNTKPNVKKIGGPKFRTVPACCIVPNVSSEENANRDTYRLVVFDDINITPVCCRVSEDSGERLKIEEVTSVEPVGGTEPLSSTGPDKSIPTQNKTIRISDGPGKGIPSKDIEISNSNPLNIPENKVDVKLLQKPVLQEQKIENPKSKNLNTDKENNIPECCKNEIITEDDNIPIISEFRVPQEQITDEGVERKNFVPLMREKIPDQPPKIRENITYDVSKLLLLEENLEKLVEQLNIILSEAQYTSFLHDLKEDINRIMNQEWIKDIPLIKQKIELFNNALNKIEENLESVKLDVKNLLNKQEMEKQKEWNREEELKEQKKVLERVNSLEKRFCKCGPIGVEENKPKPSQIPRKCSCKYKKTNDNESDKKNNKISITVQSCVLDTNDIIKLPKVARLKNENVLREFPALTYKTNEEKFFENKEEDDNVKES